MLLNPNVPHPMPHVYPRGVPSEVLLLDVADERVAYDTNDMSLHLLEDGDKTPIGSTAEIQCEAVHHPQPLGLCLVVTDLCNLRCDYCYVWGEAQLSQAGKTMDKETVLRTIDLLGRPAGIINISFFGGEPTMGWDTVKFAVERLEMLSRVTGARINFHMTTNATRIDAAKADYLTKHGFSLIVSCDGTEEHHNAHRKDTRSVGSYSAVMRSLRTLKDAGFKGDITLRGTFAPGEWERTADCLEALNKLCDDGLATTVAFEPAALTEWNCSGMQGDYGEDEIQQFMDAGTDWALDRARAGRKVRWAYLQNTLHRLYNRLPAFTECGAGAGYMSVSPDGAIHACHLRCNPIGCVKWGIDEEARRPWLEHRLTAHQGCGQCWARRICGGGCRAYNLKCSGDLHKPARLYCKLSQAKARSAMRALVVAHKEGGNIRHLLMGGDPPVCASSCSAKPEA